MPLIAACQSEEEYRKERIHELTERVKQDQGPIESFHETLPNRVSVEAAIEGIRTTCERTPNAVFDEVSKVCLCFDGQTFLVTDRGEGRCEELSYRGLADDRLRFSLRRSDQAFDVNVQLTAKSGGDLNHLYQWLVAENSRGNIPQFIPSYYSNRNGNIDQTMRIFTGPGDLKIINPEIMRENTVPMFIESLNPEKRPEEDVPFIEAYSSSSYFYEEDPFELPAALGLIGLNREAKLFRFMSDLNLRDAVINQTHASLSNTLFSSNLILKQELMQSFPVDQFLAPLEAVQSAYKEFYRYRHQSEGRFDPTQIKYFQRAACLKICDLTMRLPVEGVSWTLDWTRQYIRGGLGHSYLLLKEAVSKDPIALIVLNRADAVSMTFVNWRHFSVIQKKGMTQTFLFNRDLEIISQEINVFDLGEDSSEKQRARAQATMNSSNKASEVRTLACDVFAKTSTELDSLLAGPHQPTRDESGRLQGSWDGWLPNQSGNFSSWLSTRASFLPTLEIALSQGLDHGGVVTRLLSGPSPAHKVAQLDVLTCLNQPQDWEASISAAGIKVVNVSATTFYDRETCLAEYGPLFKKTPFFWVLGAGNGNRSAPGNLSCPQNLENFASLIRVAAVDGNGEFVGNSDYRFAEVAAEGRVQGEGEFTAGTSFAAPRVTEIAAKLFRRFPERTHAEIKLALMLGARLTSRDTLVDVRSGGIADYDLSVQVLEEYQRALEAPSTDANVRRVVQELVEKRGQIYRAAAEPLLNKVFCDSAKPCRKSERKLNRLMESGVVIR